MATTAARGYGGVHQKLRAQAKKLVDAGGVICWRCGYHINPGEPFDLGHDDVDRNVYRGPEHRRCNRATSGRRTNTARGRSLSGPRQGRTRLCEVCGGEYTASTRDQRTCGRSCGWELRRRNAPQVVIQPVMRRTKAVHSLTCSECEQTFETTDARRITCGSYECSKVRSRRMMREHYHNNAEHREATNQRSRWIL